eukprot:8898867-Lingulodinium_polyedra.AAC.1
MLRIAPNLRSNASTEETKGQSSAMAMVMIWSPCRAPPSANGLGAGHHAHRKATDITPKLARGH